ncbi:hypothetical protein NOX27_06610 [Enterobacter kobei]|uniref:hypothetical protein n=1 Tax=Enterobacter kobei TaxID=208224 RepID=UPI00210A1AA2|nr:hypothetical protein [Enterobacter kobei]MCQ4356025.1 hypothetical protein [Enterobacter kobei]HDC4312940.1 hypothetical protein [Enterobacter kobei]HDC4327313.1 hypothetical protein [Enterobacter kobei]HDC4424211.1 hypothetical protein [Enterobacter kobei]HDC4596530.1 hypothetical protein [Enterobacter kobei]
MYFSKETLATNSRLGGHWSELWANRNMWNLQNDSIIAAIPADPTAAPAFAGIWIGKGGCMCGGK